jgi:anti-sigma regulatory factor (Ser/Thr protein kinase)
MLESSSYDVVLTDLSTYALSGMELVEHVRECLPQAKVVVITAAGTPDDVIRALRERAFSYFSKPFSPNALAEIVNQALESDAADDDIEILSATPSWITLQLRARLDNADRLTQYVRELELGLSADEREHIAIAFRELLINAIEHGAGNDPSHRVVVAFLKTSCATMYYIRDPGKGFSMDDLAHAAVTHPPELPAEHLEVRSERGLRPGGFGIFMARSLADEVIYNEHGNEVLLVKHRK